MRMEILAGRGRLLLGLFGLFGLAVFGAVLLGTTLAAPRGEDARHAYRPADFPAIFNHDHSLDGLPAVIESRTPVSFVVPGPALDKDTFPCSQCHDGKDLRANPEPRPKLRDPHESRTVQHGTLWCLACHDARDYDRLHLASGDTVLLSEPFHLCAQCHGQKARDWEVGVHGRRTGYFDGPKRVLACVSCHDPHHPRFPSEVPLPPPVRPSVAKEKP